MKLEISTPNNLNLKDENQKLQKILTWKTKIKNSKKS